MTDKKKPHDDRPDRPERPTHPIVDPEPGEGAGRPTPPIVDPPTNPPPRPTPQES